jgi:glucan 1,3-beta-glucosidase
VVSIQYRKKKTTTTTTATIGTMVSSTSTVATSNKPNNDSTNRKDWIRGVNLGGWLLMERYIVPYQFAITNCHVYGDLCWYPGQISAPPKQSPDYNQLCHLYQCQPLLTVPSTGGVPDYPLDEYTLGEAFLVANRAVAGTGNPSEQNRDNSKETVEDDTATQTMTMTNATSYRNPRGLQIAEKWFNTHFDNFITEHDIQLLAAAGITHVRVPIPHWIMGDVTQEEPWIVGKRWEAFLRLCSWARKYQLQVWPDIHTAPGSQNGFDNSGHALPSVTCQGWSSNPQHVQRSLQVIRDVCEGIVQTGYTDVVTGFGLLNEPFKDCNRTVYEEFITTGKNMVRTILQNDNVSIYVSDMFLAETFNNGHWWLHNHTGTNRDTDTYLDSHYYHVFAEQPRDLSPRQHIAYTCQKQWRDATSCCYEDPMSTKKAYQFWKPTNTIPSQGVQRIVGEWSAAYDTLPVTKLLELMQGIAASGIVPEYDRTFTKDEIVFLKHFVMAQMVAYESIDTGTSAGWFYWTVKMEGGAFAEWDFLRGLQEGWISSLASPTVASEEVYGTCYDILFQTPDNTLEVIHTFPDPETLPATNWQGVLIDDDVVVTHGQSLMKKDGIHHKQRNEVKETHLSKQQHNTVTQYVSQHLLFTSILVSVTVTVLLMLLRKHIQHRQKKAKYTPIHSIEV